MPLVHSQRGGAISAGHSQNVVITPKGTPGHLATGPVPPACFSHQVSVPHRLFGQGLVSECDYERWHKQRRVMDLAFSRR